MIRNGRSLGLDGTGLVTRVVEKEVISDEATVGIYNFRRGGDFLEAADKMIADNLRVKQRILCGRLYITS